MPTPTFIKEGLARPLALDAAIGPARMKRTGCSVPKERAGESTGRRRKQLDGHCHTSLQGRAPGTPCQPTASHVLFCGDIHTLRAASRMVGSSPEPCLGLPKLGQNLGTVPFCRSQETLAKLLQR